MRRLILNMACMAIILMAMTFGQNQQLNQQHLEETVQTVLDRMLGVGRSIVYISFISESNKWEINYTKIPDIPGMSEYQGGGRSQSTVMPGIPSLKFLSGGSGEGAPLNYEVIERNPVVSNKDVVIIIDAKVKLGEIRAVRQFLTGFLSLDEQKGDKLTILKQKFTDIAMGSKESVSKQKLTSKNKLPLSTIIVIFVGLAAVVIIFVFAFKMLSRKKLLDGSSSDTAAMSTEPTEKIPEKSVDELRKEEEELQRKNEEQKLLAMRNEVLGNGARYFTFVDDENTHKLKFLLQIKIALQQATPRTIAVVMSCLPSNLAASILIEYPIKIQSEIMNNILTLQHYPENDLRQLEEEIRNSIDFLFGGKYRLKKVMDQLSGEAKKQLLSLVSRQNPPVADELNSLVILFEDILNLDETTVSRIFSDLDTEIVATSLVHMDSTYQRKVIDTLPKGVQAMVDQWLSLKGNTASRVDIDQARQEVIQFAQNLEKEGFISINHA